MTRDTSSEAWRLECEARHILTWPLQQRQAYLADLPKWRGEAATQALRAAILVEWRKRQTSAENTASAPAGHSLP